MALAEISNILVSAVCNVLADACGQAFFLSSPEMAWGRKDRLLREALKRFKPRSEDFILINYIHLKATSLAANCTMVIFLNSDWKHSFESALN